MNNPQEALILIEATMYMALTIGLGTLSLIVLRAILKK